MASKKKKPAKVKNGAPAEQQTTWTTGENPQPILAQEALTREDHGKPYTRELPSEATASELAVIAHELANVLDEERLVKEEKREANAVYRQKLAGLDDRKAKLSECVKTDRKLEQVVVQEKLRSDNLIEVIRTDTGVVIETRPATAEDLQRKIPLGDDKVAHKKLGDDDDDDDDEACKECGGENDVHADSCSQLGGKTDPAPKHHEVCEHCGIVNDHRPDCSRGEGDPAEAVTDPSGLLSGAET